jgi:hypothetical protein
VPSLFSIVAASALLLAAGAFAPQTPQPTPSPGSATTAGPGSATPAPSATPVPTATPTYRFIYIATPSPSTTPFPGPNAPQILEIDLNDQTLVTPGELRVRVVTSLDVSTVTARTIGREIGLPKAQPGIFGGTYQIPQVPAFLSGRTFDVDFIAAVPDGRTSIVTLPLGLK